MDVIVAYDIADTEGEGARRLRRIAGICENYGERVQLSVFECRLSPTRFAQMVNEIRDAIDVKQDSVVIYRFPGGLENWRTRIGVGPDHEIGKPWII